jgi:putative aldouronate transport system substrate-binding protein
MKMKKLMITALIAFFSLVLAVNGFAAGGNQSGTAGEGGGLVTLDVYSAPSNHSGFQSDKYWTEILKEDLGIQINLLPQNRDRLNAMMASGELTDIVVVHEYAQTIDMIKAGLLLNLDDHRDKLPNAFANIPNAIQFMRDNVSNDTGSLYALPNNVGSLYQQTGSLLHGPYLRWDYYKELGMPVINEIEDYLLVMKQMLDAHPVNATGQKMYGLGGWTDWDNNPIGPISWVATLYAGISGGDRGDEHVYIEADYANNITRSILDDNSWYKKGLKFFFTANQMGILDPDSVTQSANDYDIKANAHRYVFSFYPWKCGTFDIDMQEQGIGFRLVPYTKLKEAVFPPTYVGNAWSFQISRNTKKLDAALKYVDYLYSYDGILNLYYGRKGVYWDQDSNGEPYITQLGWNIAQGTQDFPNGGRPGEGVGTLNSYGLSLQNIHPILKREIGASDWIKKDFAPSDTALVADWKAVMKAEDDMDYFKQHNMLVEKPFIPMNAPPDNILQIAARVGQVIQPMSWQIILARDEAEFDRLWADMVQRAKGIGIDTVVEWSINEFNRAKTSSAKYAR